MNNYFCNIGKELSDKIQQPTNTAFRYPNMNPKTIFLTPTNSLEIINIIRTMKLKCGGVDNINVKTLQILL